MAYGRSLELREIQPHPRQGAWVPNEWRRHSKREARAQRIPRRRWLRAEARRRKATDG